MNNKELDKKSVKELNTAAEKESFLLLGDWYTKDLTKREIDKFERASVLRRMIDELSEKEGKTVSDREYARRYGINHSTLHDYLLYNCISKEEYASLKAEGLTASAIYRYIRENKKDYEEKPHTEIDIWAVELKRKARGYQKTSAVYTVNSESLIEDAINELNSLVVAIRLVNKKLSKRPLLTGDSV